MKKLFTLLSVILFCSTAFAQIPNPSFEAWDTFATYKSPKGWDNLDSATNLAGVYTCERDSPGFSGNYYLKLTSKSVPLVGVAPGVAVSGKIDFTSYTAKSGYPFTSRPHSLTGEYQFMQYGSTPGFISIFLSKWNSTTSNRDTVAYGVRQLLGMEMAWKAFSIDLKYYSGVNPDSAIIILSASGKTPAVNDFLYVDTLVFTGSVPIGTITLNSASVNESPSSITVYPNPANGYTNISYFSNSGSDIKICISDLNGRMVKSINTKTSPGNNEYRVNTSGFAPGVYFIKLVDEKGTEEKKLIIQ